MTVKELIDFLHQCQQDGSVFIEVPEMTEPGLYTISVDETQVIFRDWEITLTIARRLREENKESCG